MPNEPHQPGLAIPLRFIASRLKWGSCGMVVFIVTSSVMVDVAAVPLPGRFLPNYRMQ